MYHNTLLASAPSLLDLGLATWDDTAKKTVANELVVTIGKMHVRLAKEIMTQHGVGEENPLDYYYRQSPVFLFNELHRARNFAINSPLVADTNFDANHFLRMYKTKHIFIGRVIPGEIINTFNYANRFIEAITDWHAGKTPESFSDSEEDAKLFDMLKAKTKGKDILHMYSTQKHSKLYLTIHFVPVPV